MFNIINAKQTINHTTHNTNTHNILYYPGTVLYHITVALHSRTRILSSRRGGHVATSSKQQAVAHQVH